MILYYLVAVPFMVMLSFGLGYVLALLITAFHALHGRKPPFPPFLATPRHWGLWFAVMMPLSGGLTLFLIWLFP